MQFGIWVEPEMVNPDSDLYRKHPDWVLNFPGRPRSESRNQLVLNLARLDVRDYVEGFLDKLLGRGKKAAGDTAALREAGDWVRAHRLEDAAITALLQVR